MKLRAVGLAVVLMVARGVTGAEHTKDSLDTVKRNLADKKAILVDVREADEWNKGHLEHAILFPLSELRQLKSDTSIQQKLEQTLPKDRIIYCHCGSGVRVLSAQAVLEKLGYDIRPLEAGFSDLTKAGFPAAK